MSLGPSPPLRALFPSAAHGSPAAAGGKRELTDPASQVRRPPPATKGPAGRCCRNARAARGRLEQACDSSSTCKDANLCAGLKLIHRSHADLCAS